MRTRNNTDYDYQALASFRYAIRRFLILSDQAARTAGIEPQQFQALLAIKGLPNAEDATVGVLAERLQIQHHSAVELVDRLEAHGLLRRTHTRADRRRRLLRLTSRGESVLKNTSLPHRTELRAAGRELLRALESVMRRIRPVGNSRRHISSRSTARRAAGNRDSAKSRSRQTSAMRKKIIGSPKHFSQAS